MDLSSHYCLEKICCSVERNASKCEDRKATLIKMLNLADHLFSENLSFDQIMNLKQADDSIFEKIKILKSQSIKFILESIGDLK